MAQLSALPPPPLRPVSPLWTFRGLKRPQHVSAVQGRDVPATKLFAASVKNFCVCPRTTAPCRGSRCPIGKVHCGEKPRRSGRQKGLSPLRGSNRSARRPDSAEGDVFMTVSSTISVFCRDGVFRTVYCHLHGEPTWNGRILHTHYATGQQAEALVEHGDIRCLGPRCDKPAGHTLQNPVDGVTAYYGRDSGFRMDSEAREYRSFREAIATESTEEVRFHYVFIDGYWKVMYRTPEGWKMKALALALRRCPE
uniref:Post-segregation killing protein PndC n=72 Tax=Gammaproteobacteria TaxID=1236 RepID=C1J8S7_ECOLX|nr:hypothetical protein [Escherichia coli]QAR17244.1 hypothetical protein [Salmonella enterica subsp. enterica]QCO89859.1 hypothetical protein [Escherichia coli]